MSLALNVIVYSHYPRAFTAKDIKRIREVCARVPKLTVGDITIVPTKLVPTVTSAGRVDWGWFTKNMPPVGNNVVVFHFPTKYKRKWGIKFGGTYRNDVDSILEFWMCADKNKKPKGYKTSDTEVTRLFLHELLHGFKRKYGGNSNDVHVYDYTMKDVAIGYYTIKL